MNTRIIITGGHLTPALALIEYLQAHQPQVTPIFVGRIYSQDKLQQLSQEKLEVEQRGVKFIPVTSVRLNGLLSFVTQFGTFLRSLKQARHILKSERPAAIVSFGGYLAVPIAIMAWLRGIPIVTHEQTRTVGLATQIIGWLAQKIAVSFPETAEDVPHHKAVVVGNPLRPQLLLPAVTPEWKIPTDKPLLYVTGGNQGSVWINKMIVQLLPQLLTSWCVVHQCGNATRVYDSKAELEATRQQLPLELQMRYFVKEWFNTSEITWLYHSATAVLSRAGANTVQELQHFALPSLLIPLPFSRRDEQLLNAQHLAELGGAIVLDQNTATTEDILAALTQLQTHASEYSARLKAHPLPVDAVAQLWAVVAQYLT